MHLYPILSQQFKREVAKRLSLESHELAITKDQDENQYHKQQ